MSRGDELATTFEQVNADAIQAVEGCSEAKWQAKSEAEGWTAAALAHHAAAAQQAIFGMVQTIASGGEMPAMSRDDLHSGNAQHAKEFETVGKQDVLTLLRDAATTVPAGLRALTDEQLATSIMTPFGGGQQMSAEQVAEGILIGHMQDHTGSFKATVG